MLWIKAYYHIRAFWIKLFWKLIYGNRLRMGEKTTFRRNFTIAFEDTGVVTIGAGCFFNHDCSISCRGDVQIGNETLFGENVKIYDHNHRFAETGPIKEQGYSVGEIRIGNHCWIGSNVTFLKGAQVGDGCVIGTGCIINGPIPENTIVTTQPQYYVQPIERRISKNTRRIQ